MSTAETPERYAAQQIEREAKQRWAAEARAWTNGELRVLRTLVEVRREVAREFRVTSTPPQGRRSAMDGIARIAVVTVLSAHPIATRDDACYITAPVLTVDVDADDDGREWLYPHAGRAVPDSGLVATGFVTGVSDVGMAKAGIIRALRKAGYRQIAFVSRAEFAQIGASREVHPFIAKRVLRRAGRRRR